MILDKELMMSEAQAVTVSAASTKAPDLGKAGDAIGSELYVVARVDTAFTADGAATLKIAIQTDDNADFSSAKTLLETAEIAKTALTAGAVLLKTKLPIGVEQHLRGYYTVGTGPMTAGKIDLFLTPLAEVH
jgi:hypothetical protein